MANVQNSNTIYVDSTGDIISTRTQLIGLIVSSSGTTGNVIIREKGQSANKLNVSVLANTTEFLDLSRTPVIFNEGINVNTLDATLTATLIIREAG